MPEIKLYVSVGRGPLHYGFVSTESVKILPATLPDSAVLKSWNDTIRGPRYAIVVALLGLLLGIGGCWIHVSVGLLTFGLMLFIAAIFESHWQKVPTLQLDYTTFNGVLPRWSAMNGALKSLKEGKSVTAIQNNRRRYVFVDKRMPAWITSNRVPYQLAFGGKELYFLPDRLYIKEKRGFTAISYEGLAIQRLNDGKADTANRVRLWDSRGQIDVVFVVPTAVIASSLVLDIYAFLHPPAPRPTTSSRKSTRIAATPKPVDPCYQILGLSMGCSREEAMRHFRSLVRKHHPDKHHPDSPEHVTATNKMQELNAAYARLKELNDW